MPSAKMTRLNVVEAPLDGLTLIEANAGTGKTWTITALYVRLLLEAGRNIEQILVVTFTEAATAELRDRIRTRLSDTRAAFERGTAKEDDELITELLMRLQDREQALLRLTSALRNFDQAPIYTIHAFCQRVLGDRAFESGMPFNTEIVPDQSELLQEIVEDFWRNELHETTPLFTRYLAQKKLNKKNLSPESLRAEVERYIGKAYLEVRGPEEPQDVPVLERAYESACAAARKIWLESRDAVRDQLVNNTGLKANIYKRDSIVAWLEQMEACLCPQNPDVVLFDKFEKFTPQVLTDGTKKGMAPPKHEFYDACHAVKQAHEALIKAYERRVLLMKVRLLEYGNVELAVRKERKQLQSYDDLLLNLDKALKDERGPALIDALRKRYTAALIDEFQDTDPVQYSIFRGIYSETDLPLFLVGDPKQSIYSFRGADVFAYLNARRHAQRAHTLDVNWRSEPSLLTAVNRIFENAPAPFVVDDIPFHPSEPAPGSRGKFVVDGEKSASFELWFAESPDGKPLGKGAAGELAANAAAAEIARLLNLGARNHARIVEGTGTNERALRGGDIAVLVRSHRQAKTVRDALAKLGVASVQRGADNVFSSCEAEELERVLPAIAEPGREALISGALATEMMGYSGETLHALQADEAQWEQVVESFREAHREWHERGFVWMLRAFFQRHDVVCRLLEYTDGERRVTNVLHLIERLHCEADRHGVSGLIAWLAAKRKAPGGANDEELLRLESDENLVKILTIHVAKGLEYPLVFCPFLWDGKLWSADDDVISFHDSARDYTAVLDFGSAALDDCRQQAQREEMAESLRIMYVALTRAKYRCWMVWGHIRDAETSAPAWLLHPGIQKDAAATPETWQQTTPQLTAAGMRADLERIVASAKGTIRMTPLAAGTNIVLERIETTEVQLSARQFTGTIRDLRRVTSFTGLAHGRGIEAPDYDAGDRHVELETPIVGRDIFAFPRGAQAGKCMHSIFEHVDFSNLVRPDLERTVTRELSAHGFDTQWVRAVSDMVQSVVATPLDESGNLRLDHVPMSRRLDELEFYYPIADLSDAGLRQVLLKWGFPDEIRQRIGDLTFAPAQGYMRGFIDLVFEHGGRYYLADYKSNWLGPTVNAYQQPQLAKAMARDAYYLQYLVYCVALHRYLRARVSGYSYESHFGGVRYLFVRGMRPDSGAACGVYADRPAEGLIRALDDYLRAGALEPREPLEPLEPLDPREPREPREPLDPLDPLAPYTGRG